MDLTPQDIRRQEFRTRTFGGLDADEVQAFLDQVAAEYENRVREVGTLHEKLKHSREQINHYKLIEKTLQDTAMSMQRIVEEKTAEAHKEAEFIIAQARADAQREAEGIRQESEDLRNEVQVLKSQRTNYFIRMRSLLHSQMELLTALEREGEDDDLDSTQDLGFRNRRIQKNQNENSGTRSN